MRRRDVLPLLAAGLAWPITASTQQSGSAVRIGYLMAGARDSRIMRENTEAFRRGMLEFGYVEGRDLTINYRFAEGDFERLPAMAAELVRGNPAVIVAAPTPAAFAAKNATSTIPIVMINGGDPEDLGLVQSLAHPGGNVTGISFGVGVETFGKGLELLKQACSDLPRVGILANAANPSHAGIIKRIEAAARALNIEVLVVKVIGSHEFDKAFLMIREKGATGIIVIADVLFALARSRSSAG